MLEAAERVWASLALKYSIEHLAELTRRYPAASEMFSTYLAKALNIQELGYYERVAESAAQYAERLLRSRKTDASREDNEVARRLVYSYKDHGFVIDAQEATEIFGDNVVHQNTDVYEFAHAIYSRLDLMYSLTKNVFGKRLYYIGPCEDGARFYGSVD